MHIERRSPARVTPGVRGARCWLLVSLGVLASACAPASRGSSSSLQPTFYPPPPDTARVQFLTSITSERDLGAGRSIWQKLTGGGSARPKALTKPYGMALHGDTLYVCDTPIGGLVVISLDRGTFDFFRPKDAGALRNAVNCFVDDGGVVYVADGQRADVAIFRQGEFAGSIRGAPGAKAFRPGDVFVTGPRIWITNMARGNVGVYDRASRALLFEFPEAGADTVAMLAAPGNLYVADGFVYVSDQLRGQVNVYASDGTYVRTIGTFGQGFGQFARPRGVAVDRSGNVYVVDAAFQNVQLFDPEGRLLTFIGGPGPRPGDMALPAKVILDYDNLDRFGKYVHHGCDLQYLIFVSNQVGPAKINVYGFVKHREDVIAGVSP